jgi:hypothetical protein
MVVTITAMTVIIMIIIMIVMVLIIMMVMILAIAGCAADAGDGIAKVQPSHHCRSTRRRQKRILMNVYSAPPRFAKASATSASLVRAEWTTY